MKKEVRQIIIVIVLFVVLVLGLVFIVCGILHDTSARQSAFDNSAGVVLEKYDGNGLTLNRVTVEIPFNSLFGTTSCDKQYIVSDEVFVSIKLGSLYDGSGALGYVSEIQSLFDISENYVFY